MSQPADPSFYPASTPPGAPAQAPAPAQPEEKDAVRFTAPYRELAALVLIGAASALLLLTFVDLFVVFSGFSAFFGLRADIDFDRFVSPLTIALPIGAVLLATHVKPVAKQARLITLVALIDYGVAALFGIITLFAGFIHVLQGQFGAPGSFRDAFVGLLSRLVMLALLAFAAFIVWRVWQGVYVVPRPAPVPPHGYGYGYGYGQPGGYNPYGQPGGYGGYQQGYQQPYPGAYPPPGTPGAPGAPGAPGTPPAPGPYPSYPPAGTPWTAPAGSPGTAESAPASGAPAHAAPPDSGFDRTQVIPPADQRPAGEAPASAPPADQGGDPNAPTQRWG